MSARLAAVALYNDRQLEQYATAWQISDSKALKDAVQKGKNRAPLTEQDIPESAESLRLVNERVKECDSLIKIVEKAGEVLCACKPETRPLLLSYFLSYYGQPLIMVKREELDHCMKSADRFDLSIFLADKMRERLISPQGELFTRTNVAREDSATDTYVGARGETVFVEWHELIKAQNLWRSSQTQ